MNEHFQRYIETYGRSFLYALVSGLSVWSTALGDKAGAELWSILENRWPALLIASTITIATTLIAQLDQQITDARSRPKPPPKPKVDESTTP